MNTSELSTTTDCANSDPMTQTQKPSAEATEGTPKPLPKARTDFSLTTPENETGLTLRGDKSPDKTQVKTLTWYADPDGVHRWRESQGVFPSCIFDSVATLRRRGSWYWSIPDGANVGFSGKESTLELAKVAAERAVTAMDGEA